MSDRLHTIVALVENRPGVLNRIASKWRQRGFNIESLPSGHSEMPGLSRMTFTVDGAAHDIEQVTKQLYKVIEVVKISDVTERGHRRPRAGADQGGDDEGQPQRDHRDRRTSSARTSSTSAPDSLVVEVDRRGGQDRRARRDADAVRAQGAGAHGPRRDGARRHGDRRRRPADERRAARAPSAGEGKPKVGSLI